MRCGGASGMRLSASAIDELRLGQAQSGFPGVNPLDVVTKPLLRAFPGRSNAVSRIP